MNSAQADLFCESTKNTLSTYFEKVTPAIARTLLDKNYENNRKVNQRVVESYAQQMIKGLWHEDSGETIKISQSGKIIDGQHRLFAIIRSGELSKKFKCLNFLVIEGVPDEAINSIDDGFKRTLSNAFSMTGKALPNQAAVNGALKTLWTLKYCDQDNKHFETISSRRVSTAELMYFYDGLPKFKEVAHAFFEKFKYNRIGKVLPIGIALAMYYLYHDVDSELCFSMYKSFETGLPMDDLRERSPTYHISENASKHRELGMRIRPYTNIQLFLWCYTKLLEGKPVHKMPKKIEWEFSESNLIQAQAIKKLRTYNA